jgi:hypothetical protein
VDVRIEVMTSGKRWEARIRVSFAVSITAADASLLSVTHGLWAVACCVALLMLGAAGLLRSRN